MIQRLVESLETLDAKHVSFELLAGHMKWSHGFILGTEVEQRP